MAISRPAGVRCACHAFANQPADQPFTVMVEGAIAEIAKMMDIAIASAFGGGDGTGRVQAPLGRLTRAEATVGGAR